MTDSDMSMEEKLRTLYALQKTDSKIDQIILLRGELPIEVEQLESEIEGLKTRIARFNAEVDDAKHEISEHKHLIEEAQALMEKYKGQLDHFTNNREYESLNKQIEYQDLECKAQEKKINDLNALIAGKKAEIEETKKFLAGRQEDLKCKKSELESIIEETTKEEAVLREKREALAEKIDKRTLTAYDKVRSNARNHLAVVTIQRNACGGCFNKIPPQRQLDINSNKKLIVCEYCGRIIVSPSFDEEIE
ncbi:MAG: hypothetical protein IAB81_08400 [Bacteroidetes bacterium]|uniref:C4-type zinc ribbon domain-containing protein n=1 Tax=Candidatus Merdivivens pullicola TaxID=2840872 RepID=A0A9D9IK23_9BACT|nr:hypothetical protein [Candidatus Merdivivens pullicola]